MSGPPPDRDRGGPVRWLAFALALILASGCVATGPKKRLGALDDTLRTYAKMLRWAEYQEAARFIVFRDRPPEKFDFSDLQEVRITTYDELERVVTPEHDQATVKVRIGYYHRDYGTLEEITDVQQWWYSEEHERWYLDDRLPEFPAPDAGR